jgi:ribosomal protein L7/L12
MASEGMALYKEGQYPGTGKIACIKVVRERGCLGLKEAKDYVEAYVASHSNPVPA